MAGAKQSKMDESRKIYELTAQLLAAEGIKVVFTTGLQAPAMFDLETRVLYANQLADKQLHLTNGLIAHEIGHALYTNPTKKDMVLLQQFGGITKIFNIIEDGYQERRMCKKFRGVRKYLEEVFDELIAKDYKPGTESSRVAELLNVLNYNAKGIKYGCINPYPGYLLPDDRNLLIESEMIDDDLFINRWKLSIKLATALKKYDELTDEQLQQMAQQQAQGQGNGPNAGTGQGPNIAPSKKQKQQAAPQPGQQPGDEGDEGDGDAGGDLGLADGGGGPGSEDKGGSGATGGGSSLNEVDDYLKNELGDQSGFIDHHDKFTFKSGAPTYSVAPGSVIDEASVHLSSTDTRRSEMQRIAQEFQTNHTLQAAWLRHNREAKAVAHQLYSKFITAKTTSNIANTQYQKSGSLDTVRLTQYKITDDIFQKTSIKPDEPNHAYVIGLDFSGSMSGALLPLVWRMMELAHFSRLANVKLEVFLYTTTGYHGGVVKTRLAEAANTVMTGSVLIDVLKLNGLHTGDIDLALRNLWYLAINGGYGDFSMNGTNILEGTIYGHHRLTMLEAQRKTLIILTDGDDSSGFDVVYDVMGKQSRGGVGNLGDLLYNGVSVATLLQSNAINGLHSRSAITKLVNLFHRTTHGHKSLGIAYNNSSVAGKLDKIFSEGALVVQCDSAYHGGRGHELPYMRADNTFINEVLKALS